MKILHIGKYFPPFFGGIENFMAGLMQSQISQGHEVEAIVHQHKKRLPYTREFAAEATVYRVPILGTLIFVPLTPLFGYFLSRILKSFNANVLHLHMPNLSCFWLLVSLKARRIPWVVHWHSDVLGSAPDWKVKLFYPTYRVFELWLLNRADKIIVTSPGYLETSRALKKFKHKCHVVPLGISDKLYLADTSEVNKNQVLKLLCIGRLTYYKGHQFLLQAISLLKQSNTALHLTIVGTGELAKSLESQVKLLEIDGQVDFLGGLSDSELDQVLTNCDMLCLPSIERTEAFGMVLLEAMRASKPCLVTNVAGSGMNWVVQDKITGFVVESQNSHALAAVIEEAASNIKTLEVMGAAGRRRYEKLFSMDVISDEITQVYKKVIKPI